MPNALSYFQPKARANLGIALAEYASRLGKEGGTLQNRWRMEHNLLKHSNGDRELERRVHNFMGQRISRTRSIEVQASQGVVTIRGEVRTFYERQLLISCCQRVAGVVRLYDELQVKCLHDSDRMTFWRPQACMAY
jgi:osmotically-inducible protein OsmY